MGHMYITGTGKINTSRTTILIGFVSWSFFFLLTNVPIIHTEEIIVSSRGSGGKVWHPHINKLNQVFFPHKRKFKID